ncbi:hypothetical protein DFH09DRAFT_1067914 [Mycena vulgaris]|nr:hypothetical protein DFH09DRAFT_1067914 [Mycena vulgaris]
MLAARPARRACGSYVRLDAIHGRGKREDELFSGRNRHALSVAATGSGPTSTGSAIADAANESTGELGGARMPVLLFWDPSPLFDQRCVRVLAYRTVATDGLVGGAR